MLVGVTGPSGAGKGLAVRTFAAHGFYVIDADKVAREVVMPGEAALMQLAEIFGADLIKADGTLDRRLLANRAFASRESTDRLNDIMLTEIRKRMIDRAEDCRDRGENCLFDAPLLFEARLEEYCDCCVAVIAPLALRIRRLSERDGITEEEIRSRIKMQHEDEYYTSRCQYIIINDRDRAALEKETEKIIQFIACNAYHQ